MGVSIRVLTFNTMKLGGPAAPHEVVDRVLRLEADLMGLQEVFQGHLPGVWAHPRRLLEGRLAEAGFHTLWSPASGPGPFRRLTGDRWQDGLLTAVRKDRWQVVESGAETLSAGIFTRRITQHAVLRCHAEGRTLVWLNTHLSWGRHHRAAERRQREVGMTLELARRLESRHRPDATLLVGDLNAPCESPELAPLSRDFLDTYLAAGPPEDPGLTLDPGNALLRRRGVLASKGGRVDYVLLRPQGQMQERALRPSSSRVVLRQPDPATGHHLSDHFGLLTVLAWDC